MTSTRRLVCWSLGAELALALGACSGDPPASVAASGGGLPAAVIDAGASDGADAAADVGADAPAADASPPPVGDAAATSDAAASATDVCVFHTVDLPTCKDCCDCADIACTELTPCRNACKDHDFSTNTDLVEVHVTTGLGPTGDYSVCVAENATAPDCKECCECEKGFACGDFRFCRTLCDTSY